jgi:hypothetical protein
VTNNTESDAETNVKIKLLFLLYKFI